MVTETELAALRSLAEQTGTSLSGLCHDLIVRGVATALPDDSEVIRDRTTKET